MKRVQQAWSSWNRRCCLTRRTRLTRQHRQAFTLMSPLLSSVLLLTPLAVSAGCMMPVVPEIPVDQIDFNSIGIYLLCFFLVAIVLILLAAGVEIKAPAIGRYRPPDSKAGRIFLAVLGVLMLSLLTGLAGLASLAGLVAFTTTSMSAVPSVPPIERSMELPSVKDRRFVFGQVSFEKYEIAFKDYHSKLTIKVTGVDAEGTPIEETVDRKGRFVFDVPVGTRPMTVSWSADNLGDYVFRPIEPIEIVAPTWISFVFERVDDFFYRYKLEAIEAVRACEIEKADEGLTSLLTVLERFDKDLRSQTQTWPHDVYHELADEASNHRSCAQNAWMFERKWRREAIERATNRDSRIRAMNAWADYSRQVYRPNEEAWEWTSTLDNVVLAQEGYKEYLREDLQLGMATLAKKSVRKLVSKTIESPTIAGCLNRGQRDALRSFESLLPPEPEKEVYLNQMMNALSGLHHVVTPHSRLGTWTDYPYPGAGEIEIVRRELGDESRYYYWYQSKEECTSGELAFAPEESTPRRFELMSTDRVFVILRDGSLQMEPGGNFRAKQPGG